MDYSKNPEGWETWTLRDLQGHDWDVPAEIEEGGKS